MPIGCESFEVIPNTDSVTAVSTSYSSTSILYRAALRLKNGEYSLDVRNIREQYVRTLSVINGLPVHLVFSVTGSGAEGFLPAGKPYAPHIMLKLTGGWLTQLRDVDGAPPAAV